MDAKASATAPETVPGAAPGTAPDTEAARIAGAFLANAVGGPRRHPARFHTLTVSAVRRLTDDAVEVTFAVPDRLREDYAYLAGQHVALRVRLDGNQLRRSYSLCRPPTGSEISVAIKRDVGGRFSTWAQNELHTGDELDVMSPQGTFTTRLEDLEGKHLVGVAAGSGITPLMALATTVLARSRTARFTLLYTNRSRSDVMFLDDLADLKDRYPSRLALYHVLSREQRAAPLLSGRIDEAKLRTMLDVLIRPATVDEWFLCGPFDLVQLCRDTLTDVGVDRAHIRHELFTTGEPGQPVPSAGHPVITRADEPVCHIRFTLEGQTASVDSPRSAHETILNAALRVRADTPYACAGGVCGTCRAKLIAGDVRMTENFALEPEELERGYILTCQSHPTTEEVVVDYDA